MRGYVQWDRQNSVEQRRRSKLEVTLSIGTGMASRGPLDWLQKANPDSEPALIQGRICPGNSGHYGIRTGKG